VPASPNFGRSYFFGDGTSWAIAAANMETASQQGETAPSSHGTFCLRLRLQANGKKMNEIHSLFGGSAKLLISIFSRIT
jgi:hypothetical protein